MTLSDPRSLLYRQLTPEAAQAVTREALAPATMANCTAVHRGGELSPSMTGG
jgi:hypothetical protein